MVYGLLWNEKDLSKCKFGMEDFKEDFKSPYMCIWNKTEDKIPYGRTIDVINHNGNLYARIEFIGYTNADDLYNVKTNISSQSGILDFVRIYSEL